MLTSYTIIELEKTTTVAFRVTKSLITHISLELRIALHISKSVRNIADAFYITYTVKLLLPKIMQVGTTGQAKFPTTL